MDNGHVVPADALHRTALCGQPARTCHHEQRQPSLDCGSIRLHDGHHPLLRFHLRPVPHARGFLHSKAARSCHAPWWTCTHRWLGCARSGQERRWCQTLLRCTDPHKSREYLPPNITQHFMCRHPLLVWCILSSVINAVSTILTRLGTFQKVLDWADYLYCTQGKFLFLARLKLPTTSHAVGDMLATPISSLPLSARHKACCRRGEKIGSSDKRLGQSIQSERLT